MEDIKVLSIILCAFGGFGILYCPTENDSVGFFVSLIMFIVGSLKLIY